MSPDLNEIEMEKFKNVVLDSFIESILQLTHINSINKDNDGF